MPTTPPKSKNKDVISALDRIASGDLPGAKRKLMTDIDEGLTKYVVEPSVRAGFPRAGAGVAAVGSAAAELAIPGSAEDIGMMAAGPVLKLGKMVAKSGGTLDALQDLRKLVGTDALQDAAKQIRLHGDAIIRVPGQAPMTIGRHSAEGKGLHELGGKIEAYKDSKRQADLVWDEAGNVTRPGASTTSATPKKEPPISGEAAAFKERTTVDPTRRNALSTIQDLRAIEDAKRLEALRKMNKN